MPWCGIRNSESLQERKHNGCTISFTWNCTIWWNWVFCFLWTQLNIFFLLLIIENLWETQTFSVSNTNTLLGRRSVGFESNLNNNAVRKKEKFLNLINKMSRNYRCVRFVNLSMSSLGVFPDECSTFLDMMNEIGIDKKQQLYIILKMINITIRATYYIFCCRNRNWDNPDLMQFCFLSFSFLFFSFFFFAFVLFVFFF